jgi:hypothetical protein
MPLSPSPLNEIVISCLYEALKTRLGITVSTNDPQRARRLFYSVRQELGDPSLNDITISFSPSSSDSELWLVRKPQEQSQEQSQEPNELGIKL